MSTYSTIQGCVTYPDDESFNRMVDLLRTGFWMDEEGFFIDECGTQVSTGKNPDPAYTSENNESAEPDIDPVNRSITIPCCHYRNLGAVDFFQGKTAKGELVGTCADGTFIGWQNVNGEEKSFDLIKWAAENLEGDDARPPKRSEYKDEVGYEENLNEWQNLVESEFHSDL